MMTNIDPDFEPTDEELAWATNILLDDALDKKSRHYDATYDGVRGPLPGWLPDWARTRYREVQEYLFDECGWKQERILVHVEQYGTDHAIAIRKHPNGKNIDRSYEWHQTVGFLAHLRWVVSAPDPERGLERLGDSLAGFGYAHWKGCVKGGQTNATIAQLRIDQARVHFRKLCTTGTESPTSARRKVAKKFGVNIRTVWRWIPPVAD